MPNETEDILQKYRKTITKIPFHIIDHHGFVCETKPHVKFDEKLLKKWHTTISKYKNIRDDPNLHDLIFQGIPIELKNKIWLQLQLPFRITDNEVFNILKTSVCSYEHQIHVDVQRTFRKHGLFYDEYGIGQIRLFGILVAYANFNKKVGYCQGMSSFAGLLLMYFPEKQSFDIMRHLIDKNKLENLFDDQLSLLTSFIFVQNEVCSTLIPHLYEYIIEVCELNMFVARWYLTLFSRFEIGLVLRIWDLFMYYGVCVFFIVVVALLKTVKDKILKKNNESLLHYLSGMENESWDVDIVIGHVKKFMKKVDLEKYKEVLSM